MKAIRSLLFTLLFASIPAHAEDPAPQAVPEAAQKVEAADLYQLLLAEIALRRGDASLAAQAYADISERLYDPRIMERTVEIAGFAQHFDIAIATARRWLDDDPSSREALRAMASALVTSNRLGELAPHLIALLESEKATLPDNLLGLNRLFARNPDRAAVYRLIDAVCQPFSGMAEAHYAVAMAAGGAGMSERARQEILQALQLRPGWEMPAILLSQLLMRDSRDEAIAFMEDFLDRHPEANQLRLSFARVLIGEHRYLDARREFERLLRDLPNDPDILYAVAMLALQFDDKRLAEARLKDFIALDTVSDRNSAYFHLGEIAEDGKRVEEALSRYAQVISGQHYLPAKTRQARLLFAQGKFGEGRDLLSSARVTKREEQIQLQIAEAALLREAGHFQEAFDFLESRLAESPEQPELMYESALLAERLDKRDLMQSRLRRLIELRPDNPMSYNALGYMYADRNERLEEARQLIEKALALAPDDGAILDSMGWVLFRQGDLRGALSYLERSYDRNEDPEIAAHLGEVLWTMGRREDARQLLLDAQKKFPSSVILSETVRRFAP